MKLRFTPRAVENITAIAEYIRVHNPAAASRVRTAIYESLQTILLFPRAGRHQRPEGVYKMVTRRYPYAIYYAIDQDANEVIVVSVRHAAQRPEYENR